MAKTPSITLSNGYQMPMIGLGTFDSYNNNYQVIETAVSEALAAGYRHFDCAWKYENEKEVGQALRAKIAAGIIKREELFITSKLWNPFHHPDDVEKMFMDSLKNLDLDYIDLFLIHWPITLDLEIEDPTSQVVVDYLDTWKELEKLVDSGLVRSIGVSNFNSKQIQRILSSENLKHKPVCNQIEVTPYLSNEKLVKFCQSHNIAVTAFSPLGALNNTTARPDKPSLLEDSVISAIAKRHKKSQVQVLLKWGIQRGYAVIPKSVTPSRIRENIQIFDFSLTKEEMDEIHQLNRNYRLFPWEQAKSDPHYPFHEEF